jgi:hypothetical protein
MTIPLDNLYHYINSLFLTPVYIYLFYPHGSRDILNLIGLTPVSNLKDKKINADSIEVVCNDQEPLNYAWYQNHSQHSINFFLDRFTHKQKFEIEYLKNCNLRLAMFELKIKKIILLHSEQNSPDLESYSKNNYVGVYYWCHAVLARDWYRFAHHDARLYKKTPIDKDFLIYCRDWTGSREYRIKFQELLVKHSLHVHSKTSINKLNLNYQFSNNSFCPENFDFVEQLDSNEFDSSASADYVAEDFVSTNISVVLETVFDGTKIHLTEKILRAIACAHPFILAAGPGSLEYLRDYGFKTFSPWLDESYDCEPDSVLRLEKIIQSMKLFAELPPKQKAKHVRKMKKIANYNKRRFFSKKFSDLIINELKSNIQSAVSEIIES